MIADVERVASRWLRDQASELRVVGRPPAQTDTPWVEVIQLDATDQTPPTEHLVGFLMQFSVYAGRAGGQPEANQVGRQVRAIIHNMTGVHDDVVVTGVEIVGDARIADSTFEPSRERRILSAMVWAYGTG